MTAFYFFVGSTLFYMFYAFSSIFGHMQAS